MEEKKEREKEKSVEECCFTAMQGRLLHGLGGLSEIEQKSKNMLYADRSFGLRENSWRLEWERKMRRKINNACWYQYNIAEHSGKDSQTVRKKVRV